MKRACVLIILVAACGDNSDTTPADAFTPVDAAVETDAPPGPDPFAGMYDSPDDFPRTDCRAGALAGFDHQRWWPDIGLRTEIDGGGLHTFGSVFLDEVEVPHQLTADDLLLRRATFTGRWRLQAIHVCDVGPGATLIGTRVTCTEGAMTPCRSYAFTATPFARTAGESEASGLSIIGEVALPARVVNVRVGGGVAFLSAYAGPGRGALITVSLANPAAPTILATVEGESFYNDVKLIETGGRRYAVMAGSPTDIYEVTNPAAPALIAQVPVAAHTVFVEGTRLYLVANSGEPVLHIWDLAPPSAPVERGRFTVPDVFGGGGIHDLHVAGGIATLSLPDSGLAVVDCRNPAAPVLMGRRVTTDFRYWHSPWAAVVNGRPLIVHGDEFAPGLLEVLDGDPASPTYLDVVGTWTPRPDVSLHNVMIRGARVYVAHYAEGLRVLDLSTPSAPVQVAYLNTWREQDANAGGGHAFGLDLDPANGRIYLADSIRGLIVVGEP